MSKMITCRIPDELNKLIEDSGKSRSFLMNKALEMYFQGELEPEQDVIQPEKIVIQEEQDVLQKSHVIHGCTKSVLQSCPRCGGSTVEWGAMSRCHSCKINI